MVSSALGHPRPQKNEPPTTTCSALAGALTARDVLLGEAGGGGGGGALAQLRALRDWFSGQGSLQFFASSVLLVYEGAARSAAEARTAVRFVDFAHVFLASGSSGDGSDAADRRLSAAVPPGECPALAAGGSSQQQHVTVQAALTGCSAMPSPAVGDSNCLRGLDSLIATLQRVAEGANYTSAITSTT